MEINYKDGKEDGKVTVWHLYGGSQKWMEINYKDCKLDGKLTYWNEDGTINRVLDWPGY